MRNRYPIILLLAVLNGASAAENPTPETILRAWQSRCAEVKSADISWESERFVPKGSMTLHTQAMWRFRLQRGERLKTEEQILAMVVPAHDERFPTRSRLRHEGAKTHFASENVIWLYEEDKLAVYPSLTHWHAGRATQSDPKGLKPGMPEQVVRSESAEVPASISYRLVVMMIDTLFGRPGFRGADGWKGATIENGELVLPYQQGQLLRVRCGTPQKGYRAETIAFRFNSHDRYRIAIRRGEDGEVTGWQTTLFNQGSNATEAVDTVRIVSRTTNPPSIEVPEIVPGRDAHINIMGDEKSNERGEFRVGDGKGNERLVTQAELFDLSSPLKYDREDKNRPRPSPVPLAGAVLLGLGLGLAIYYRRRSTRRLERQTK